MKVTEASEFDQGASRGLAETRIRLLLPATVVACGWLGACDSGEDVMTFRGREATMRMPRRRFKIRI